MATNRRAPRRYWWLLWMMPPSFRHRFAHDLDLFLSHQREELRYRIPVWGAIRFGLDVGLDLVTTALRLRFGRSDRPPTSARGSGRAGHGSHGLGQDLAFGLRSLRRSPTYTAVAVMTLALGIGATTAMFTVVRGVILRPLPYPDSDRLVHVSRVDAKTAASDEVSYPDFQDWREESRSFTGLEAFAEVSHVYQSDGAAEHWRGSAVSAGVFPLLRTPPLLGRWFTDDEDRIGGPRAVILSHAVWTDRFGADSGVVGRAIVLEEIPHEIVGVMPVRFAFPEPDGAAYWVPLREHELLLLAGVRSASRGLGFLDLVARLEAGVDVEGAQRELREIAGRIDATGLAVNGAVRVRSWHAAVTGDVRPMLYTLLGAVSLVLAIACANVANLSLTRFASRERELAIRTALGGGRARLLQLLLIESALLALGGGVLGLTVAWSATDAIVTLGGASVPRGDEVGIDPLVLAFTMIVSLGSVIAFGLWPAWHVAQRRLALALSGGSRGGTSGRRTVLVRDGLVVAQVALALVLLAGAGLLLNSFLRLTAVDPGFEPRNLLTATITLPPERYPDDAAVVTFFTQLREDVEGLPGVASAATTYSVPFNEQNFRQSLYLEGDEAVELADRPWAGTVIVGPGFFRTQGLRLIRGRELDEGDRGAAPQVTVVNQTMAEQFWPGQDPIGRRFRVAGGISGSVESLERRFFTTEWITVVGVVADVRRRGLELEREPEFYRPHAQMAWPGMSIMVRTAGAPGPLAAPLRAAVWRLDRTLAVTRVATVRDLIEQSVAAPRFRTSLVSAFAGMAALLAAIGLYGVTAYVVSQRTREIGVRLALGASHGRVVRDALTRGWWLTSIGIVVGLSIALAATRVLSAMLFGVTAHDPVTYGAIAIGLASVATIACYVPARRASRVDPIIALRDESGS